MCSQGLIREAWGQLRSLILFCESKTMPVMPVQAQLVPCVARALSWETTWGPAGSWHSGINWQRK